MSGPIRQQLGPTKKRVLDQTQEAKLLQKCENETSQTERKLLAKDVHKLYAKLEKNCTTFKSLKQQFVQIMSESKEEEEQFGEQLVIFTEIELDADDAISELKEFLKEEEKQEHIEHNKINEPNYSKFYMKVNLPKLEIPKFNGDILKWMEFWDAFNAAIHSNSNLEPVSKLTYLRSILEGEALNTITGIQLSNENYEVALQLLQARFGKKQMVIDAHYAKLTNIQRSSNETYQLRNTYDSIEKHLRSLQALGEDINHRHFITMIMSKLPTEIRVALEEQNENEQWTVKLLRERLEKKISARESAERNFGYNLNLERSQANLHSPVVYESEKGLQNSNNHSKQPKSSTEALFSAEKTTTKMCVYCNLKNHWSDECKTYHTIESRKAKIKGRCYICFSQTHVLKNCKSTKCCVYCKQKKNHHRSLCPKKFESTKRREVVSINPESVSIVTPGNQNISTEQTTKTDEHSCLATGEKTLMQTATARMQDSGKNYVNSRLLFDCGSQRSYITEELARKLQLKPKRSEILNVYTFGSNETKTLQTKVVQLQIQLIDGTTLPLHVNVVPQITGNIQRFSIGEIDRGYLWKDLPLADSLPKETETTSIEVLIGNDYYWDFITSERMQISPGLYLIGSKLGWILNGRIKSPNKQLNETSMLTLVNSLPNFSNLQNSFTQVDNLAMPKPGIEEFWNLETIGIKEPIMQTDDEIALDMFNKTVKYHDGRYQIRWPFKEDIANLPVNYQLALGRFKTLARRLDKDSDLHRMYSEIIDDQIQKGVIEKVPDNEMQNSIKHYIPHHPVVTPTKTTTKVRIVYDASSKERKEDKTLNECLHRGPVILEDLCGLLIRFRTKEIGIVADIEKAFLQIGLQTQDRDVTRFFWFKDPKCPIVSGNIQEYRFCRLPFGMISSPFLLAATISHHLQKTEDPVIENIKNNMYVDNLITGINSTPEVQAFYFGAKDVFKKASMNLREWSTNSQELLDCIKEEDRASNERISVLGSLWDIKNDTLTILNSHTTLDDLQITKRTILRAISMIFDPLGYFSPVILEGKLFLQQLWNEQKDWDDVLTEDQQTRWKVILRNLQPISNISIPRFIGTYEGKTNQLLSFCDASSKAYTAVTYLRTGSHACYKTNLVFAKTRLNPPKRNLSIPRLELLAVLIGVRSMAFVNKQLKLPISKLILWTDSQCTLHWLKSNKSHSTFVQNRVKEIREHSDYINFRYISTSVNPADIGTRGMPVSELENSKLWWQGPDWLAKPENKWPNWNIQEISKETLDNIESETKFQKVIFETSNITQETNQRQDLTPFQINERNYSSLNKLLRVTAWCLRFVNSLRKRCVTRGPLTAVELSKARLQWELTIQNRSFPAVVKAIRENKPNNLKHQLGLQLDDNGFIRCFGRLGNCEISEDTIFPKLLPKNNHYTKLVVENCHQELHHAGVNHTLSQVRLYYWIPHGRTIVRKILLQCKICRRWEGGPYKTPPLAAFPKYRVSRSSPFTYVGLDYLGPLYVKDNNNVQKVWVCLFTCISIRAVHLELARNMSAEQFLLCLRRFIARRGSPEHIICDNAQQFKLVKLTTEKAWKEILLSAEVNEYTASKRINWKFITEYAPWKGGFYERLVGLIKRSLRKGIGNITLSYDNLSTILTEVEATINSRPLIYIGSDINNGHCLTPANFLSLNPKKGYVVETEQEDSNYVPNLDSAENLLRVWKKGQNHLQMFWKIWQQEYLLSLRERYQKTLKSPRIESKSTPNTGDVVLIKEKDLPRGRWKIAMIQTLEESEDSQVRTVKLELPSGKTVTRPLNLIYPLECSDDTKEIQVENSVDLDEDKNKETKLRRTMRRAALEAKEKITKLYQDDQ